MTRIDRKQAISWCMYDFANSSYSAVIAAVVFPVYYANHIVGNSAGLGDLWWGRSVSMSMMVIAVLSPMLGGMADFTGLRKRFLVGFTLLSVCSIAALSVLRPGMVHEGFALAALANIGMEGAMNYYNAYLPEIAPREYQGRLSSWGFGVGYAGSIFALLCVLPLVSAGWFAASWVAVAAMFLFFSMPAFLWLPPDQRTGGIVEGASEGMARSVRVLRHALRDRNSALFLISYFMFTNGVSTVIVFSSIYAATTLNFANGELIGLYIVVQLTALAGSFLMASTVDRRGPRFVTMISLVLWCGVCVAAYMVEGKAAFWVVASVAGLGLGTVQAASRALYARFIPVGSEAEYFGLFAMAGKTSSVLGPLVFGYVSSAAGSQRPAILSIGLFFLIGLIALIPVRDDFLHSE